MTSIGSMIKQLSGMIGTKDLSGWENNFVASVLVQSANGAQTHQLSSKQVETVESIYSKHFG